MVLGEVHPSFPKVLHRFSASQWQVTLSDAPWGVVFRLFFTLLGELTLAFPWFSISFRSNLIETLF